MKKTIPGLLLALLLTVSLLTPGALADDGPLVISTPEQLADFRDEVNSGIDYDGKMVVLGGDIDFSLSDVSWEPIGNGTRDGSGYEGYAFKGTFDGRGYTISGLKINAAAGNADDAYGLFGVIDGATVTNLTLANISIDVENGECVGGVVGLMVNDSTVSNIEMDVGSSISAVRGLGGIVVRMTISGTIENCINEASVSGSGANVGGIVGAVYNAAVVTGNENYAESISGTTFAAGIVGNIQNDSGFYSADPDVKIYNNITTTDLNSISANCRDLYAYNNHFTEAAYSVADNGSTWVAQIGAQKYATLAGAMDAAVEAGSATIELLGDITVTKTVELDSANADITLDLYDHKITGDNCRVLWIKSGSMSIVSTGRTEGVIKTVAAQDDPIEATSSVIRVGSDDGAGDKAALTVGTYGEKFDVSIIAPDTYGISVFGAKTHETLTVYGDVSATGPRGAIAGNGTDPTPTTITIDGGSVSADKYYAIYHPQNGKLTVKDSYIGGLGGIQMCAGELVIGAGTNIYAKHSGEYGTVEGDDGAIIDGAAVSLVARSGYKGLESVSIEGGSFHSENGVPIKLYSWDGSAAQAWDEAPTGFISAGKFSTAVDTAWLDPGLVYQLVTTGFEESYSYYKTLEEALEHAEDDSVITEVGSTGAVCTVTLDPANGNEPFSYKLGAGIELSLPAVSKPGYIFMGWKCSDGHTHDAGESVTIKGDVSFTALWANMPDITPSEPDDEPDVPELPFTDVSEGQWFYEAVEFVYSEGIMNGMDRYTFEPNGSLTRAMVWTMLARLDGVDTEGGANWYAIAQEWALDKGVSDGTNPMGAITREELVTMLWRYSGSEVSTGSLAGYSDYADISGWAGQAMLWATVNGIIEGDAGALRPGSGCTRAEAAAILMRFCSNIL